MSKAASRARTALGAASLIAAACLAYSNALDLPFLFDDHPAIEQNLRIRTLWPPWAALAPPRDTPVAGRPLVNATLALNYAWGGLDPRGYHVFNLAVHIACGLLLFGLVRRTVATFPGAGALRPEADGLGVAAAAIWLVHPLTSECVDYVTQRTESIMSLFHLATLYCVSRTATAEGAAARRGFSAAAVAACALGMASKETMVTAPLVALLYDAAFHAGSIGEALRRRRALYLGLASSWLVLLGLVAAAPRSRSVGVALGVTPWTYLLNQAWVLSEYLHRAVWPHPLILDYGWPRPVSLREVLPHAALVIGGVAVALVTAWRRPALGFPALAGLLVLAPTSSFFPIVTEVGTERRMYLPLAGLVVLAVLAGHAALSSRTSQRRIPLGVTRRRIAAACVLASVAGLASVTRARNHDYRSEEAIWRTSVAALPGNPRALLNLGEALRKRGALDEAERLFARALALHPPYGRAEAHLGQVAFDRGHARAGEMRLRRALLLEPRLGDVRSNLGEILLETGRTEEAIAQWREALAIDPGLAFAANNLAWVLATHRDVRFRDPDGAVRWAEHGAELSVRSDPFLLDTLAAAYAAAGRWQAAQSTARRAISLARESGEPELAAAMSARLELYLRRHAYREDPEHTETGGH